MPERPTAKWRRDRDEQSAELQAGTLKRDEAWALSLYPDAIIVATDSALTDFDEALTRIDHTSDTAVLGAVQQVVLALNRVDADPTSRSYDTDDREELCEYIDDALTSAGVDVEALAARNGLRRWAITDRWREW
ncbi:hypothetical protein [Plantactinospora sp. B5E13]|uniref:hypothetical protein n=1 Tax=Plantactinospora sp. B5E13 TaxID=3153758 RepID=UPI00325C64F6